MRHLRVIKFGRRCKVGSARARVVAFQARTVLGRVYLVSAVRYVPQEGEV